MQLQKRRLSSAKSRSLQAADAVKGNANVAGESIRIYFSFNKSTKSGTGNFCRFLIELYFI